MLRFLSLRGIRAHLIGLVLFASVPMAALVVYDALQVREAAVKETTVRLKTVAKAVAGEMESQIEGARHLLSVLAEVPSVRSAEQPACSRLLGDFVQRAPRDIGLSLTVAAHDGPVVCSWAPLTGPVNLADREYFKEALAKRDAVVGRPVISRISNTSRLPLAHPILNPAGAVEKLVTAAISLDQLAAQFTASSIPADATFSIWDERGMVLFRYPGNEEWFGTVQPDAGIVKAVAASKEARTIEVAGLDGVHRVYALAVLDNFPQLGLTISVGISKEILTAEADRALRNSLALLTLIFAAALAGAWALGEITIRRRVAVIAQAASRIAGGALETRIGGPYRGGELGQLGRAFDEMAAAMQRQITDIRRGEQNLRLLNAELEQRVAERTADLEKMNARTESILNTVVDGVIAINERGVVETFNPAAERIFGYAASEVVGRNIKMLMPEPYHSGHDGYLERFRVTGEARIIGIRREVVGRCKDGSTFPMQLAISEMRLGGERYFIGTVQDITARKQTENAIIAAKEAADTANRAKSTFLATMSHEIRTPMNGVLGMLELLSMTKLEGEQRTTLEIVQESGKSLLRIIDDILDFSKIEAEKLEVRPEVVSIKEVIEGVRNIYAGNASSKGLLINFSVDSRISPAVLVDPLRLRQILSNFLSNALKFTAQGTIEIKAELIGRADGEDSVRFSVKDTGIGISAENQQQLFQPFIQAEGDTTRRYGGTGLGLAICRRLAEMMGGSIEMVSELGKGTTMILTLSLPIADPKDLPKTDPAGTRDLLSTTTSVRRLAPSVAQAEKEGTLVLLVDDHPTNRLLLMRQVHALGYTAESAENGVEALDKWKSGRFAMLITDCNMPEMDGHELARGIRRLESANGAKRTPIIACTANALGGEAEMCFAAGMDDYLAKPVALTELWKKLDQWLPIPAAAPSEKPRKSSVAPTVGADAAAPIERSVLAAISGGDVATEREILMGFRRATDEDAATLDQAVAKNDIGQVTRTTHRIKGASRMVGAMGLAGVSERLEHASRSNDWQAIEANMGSFHQEWMRLNAYFDSL